MTTSVGSHRTLGRFLLLGIVMLSFGCKHRSPEAFWKNLAKAGCKWSKSCEKEAYRATYDSARDCREQDYDLNGDPDRFASDCEDYDEDIGRSCLAWYNDQRDSCTVPSGTPDECEDICGPGSSISFSTVRSITLDGAPAEHVHGVFLNRGGDGATEPNEDPDDEASREIIDTRDLARQSD